MHAVTLILMCILTFLSEDRPIPGSHLLCVLTLLSEHRPHPGSHTPNPSQSTDSALAPLSSSSLSTEV